MSGCGMSRQFQCDCCGAVFHTPSIRRVRENLDGERGIWNHDDLSCPYCGSEDLSECREREK